MAPPSIPPGSHSLPEARFLGRWFTAARRSGLLTSLSGERWRTLSVLFSFLTRDGRCLFTLDQLAYALGLSPEDAARHLDELCHTMWHEQPLALLEYDATGAVVGAVLGPLDLFAYIEPAGAAPPAEAAEGEDSAARAADPAYPDAARPPVATEPSAELAAALAAVGLYPDQVERILAEYPEERIRQQLKWLPARKARVPAALLLRAIDGDWGAPKEAA